MAANTQTLLFHRVVWYLRLCVFCFFGKFDKDNIQNWRVSGVPLTWRLVLNQLLKRYFGNRICNTQSCVLFFVEPHQVASVGFCV